MIMYFDGPLLETDLSAAEVVAVSPAPQLSLVCLGLVGDLILVTFTSPDLIGDETDLFTATGMLQGFALEGKRLVVPDSWGYFSPLSGMSMARLEVLRDRARHVLDGRAIKLAA
jgi:hypothetical protein